MHDRYSINDDRILQKRPLCHRRSTSWPHRPQALPKRTRFLLRTALISFLLFGSEAATQDAWASPRQNLNRARELFKKQEYNQSIVYYRKYLRKKKKNYEVWSQLGAAYFHAGLPKRSIRILSNFERKVKNRSYNFYYQGLSYKILEQRESAIKYFSWASQYQDEYGSRAVFELAVLEYNAKNDARTRFWSQLYLQRFPRGVHRRQLTDMLASLNQGRFLDEIKGVRPEDEDKAIYKHSKLSLMDYPHFWLTQLGGTVLLESDQDPTQSGLQTRNEVSQGITAHLAFGLGPIQTETTTSWAGYSYRQLWLTDSDRVQTYLKEPSDIEFQPFQMDLLERKHQLFGDFRRKVTANIYLGFFGKLEFVRIGSQASLRTAEADPAPLNEVLKVTDTSLLIPWVGITYLKNYRTQAYLYFRKEINDDSPEHSNKTYAFFDTDNPGLSFGISQSVAVPEFNLDLTLEAFQYEFLFNDYWLDYTRQGFFASLENEFIPTLYLNLAAGMYKDRYLEAPIRSKGCTTAPKESGFGGASSSPASCPRDDTGWMLQFGVYWNYSQFHRLTFSYLYAQNQNPEQKEYEETKQEITFGFSMAFPSVKRVTRFVDRFADFAFTKEAE